jgi:DUF3078 family protein
MKKTTTLVIASLLVIASITTVKAQDTKTDAANLQTEVTDLKAAVDTSTKYWKKGGIITLNGQEGTQFNWAAGGQNAISVGGLVNMFFNYHKGDIIWNNNIILAYGVIKQGSVRDWIKTDDRIQLTTKVGKYAFKKAYYTLLGDFKSQFAPGYNYPNDSTKISNFMAPGYVLAGLGLDFEVDTNLSFFISPATGRFTFVEDNTLAKSGMYGVQAEVDDAHGNVITPYKKVREQIGAYLKMQYRKTVMTNVSFGTTLELYADYLNHPENMYVNWTTFIVMKVNKFISATFNTQLIYDPVVKILQPDGTYIGPRVQFKQILGIGLAYKF